MQPPECPPPGVPVLVHQLRKPVINACRLRGKSDSECESLEEVEQYLRAPRRRDGKACPQWHASVAAHCVDCGKEDAWIDASAYQSALDDGRAARDKPVLDEIAGLVRALADRAKRCIVAGEVPLPGGCAIAFSHWWPHAV